MSVFNVELEAFVIPDDHTVWKVSPGKTYRFYRAVAASSFIFPDIRGLEGLQSKPANWQDDDVLKQISSDRYAREQNNVANGGSAVPRSHVVKSDKETLTFANRIWKEAKLGDLVVVPADGYDKDVMIGMIVSAPGVIEEVSATDGTHTGKYFGRRVKWLHSEPKFELDGELIKALHARAAVYALEEKLKESIYRLAFGNFTYKGHYVAEFRTEKKHFTAEDAAVVTAWLNGFQVLHHKLGGTFNLSSIPSFAALGLAPLPDAYAGELKININSPGEIFIRTAGPLALSLMALFSLSGCDSSAVVNQGVTIKLQSVAGAAAGEEAAVKADIEGLANALGEQRLAEANDLAQRAAKDAKVSTRAKVN